MKCSCCHKSEESSVNSNEQINKITSSRASLLDEDQSLLERAKSKSEDIEANKIKDSANQENHKIQKIRKSGNAKNQEKQKIRKIRNQNVLAVSSPVT